VIEDRGSIGSDEQQRLRPTEDDKSGESQKVPQTTQRAASGRPPAYESRAAEFRRRLIVWKQTPESMRPSLRALAGELGTSHQILVYHLNRLDRWQAQERAKRIRAEGRPFTAALVEVGADTLWRIKQEARRGPLNGHQVKILKLFAKQGFSGAREILEKCRQMTPEEERQARAAEKAAMFTAAALKNIERIKQEAERGPLPGGILRF